MNDVHILEDTFRDSLYITDFLIELDTVFDFVKQLTEIGFEYIEVGHSLGLGAYRTLASSFTDEELLVRIQPLCDRAKFFCFFIPAVGRLEDMQKAAGSGIYGIRVGMNAPEVPDRLDALEAVKKAGFYVCLNLMKSYSISPQVLGRMVKDAAGTVDMIYLVDSAGCMFPEDIRVYLAEMREQVGEKMQFGFHGHNNLNMAVANAVTAVECGVSSLDTTLGGIGRSGGNIPTETLIAVLRKKGFPFEEKLLLQVLELSWKYKLYLKSKGRSFSVTEDDILYGYTGFHSSFEDKVRKFAEDEGLDYRQLIIELCKIDQTQVSDQTLAELAQRTK